MSVQLLADAGDIVPAEHPVRTAAANGELMFKVPAR